MGRLRFSVWNNWVGDTELHSDYVKAPKEMNQNNESGGDFGIIISEETGAFSFSLSCSLINMGAGEIWEPHVAESLFAWIVM